MAEKRSRANHKNAGILTARTLHHMAAIFDREYDDSNPIGGAS
jgi:hypothetical protein